MVEQKSGAIRCPTSMPLGAFRNSEDVAPVHRTLRRLDIGSQAIKNRKSPVLVTGKFGKTSDK